MHHSSLSSYKSFYLDLEYAYHQFKRGIEKQECVHKLCMFPHTESVSMTKRMLNGMYSLQVKNTNKLDFGTKSWH